MSTDQRTTKDTRTDQLRCVTERFASSRLCECIFSKRGVVGCCLNGCLFFRERLEMIVFWKLPWIGCGSLGRVVWIADEARHEKGIGDAAAEE